MTWENGKGAGETGQLYTLKPVLRSTSGRRCRLRSDTNTTRMSTSALVIASKIQEYKISLKIVEHRERTQCDVTEKG